jgi:hypothetical protein
MAQLDETIREGFTKLTEAIRSAVGRGIKDPFDLGVYAHIKMEADWSTGIYHGNALKIAYRFGTLKLHPKIKRCMFRLRKARLINYKVAAGAHGSYDVLVDGFQVTLGGLKGQYLNAWAHSTLAIPEYEDAARERPEDGPTQDVLRSFVDVSDVSDDQAKQSSAPPGSADASPLRGMNGKTDDKDNNKDKDNDDSEDSGSVPNPPVEDFSDSDWDQDTEDALICWQVVYGNSYDLGDFLFLQKFDSKIKATLQGHGTLPLIIQWAKWICNDNRVRHLESSTQFREEFARNILPKFTRYTNTTTPLLFTERCHKLFLADDGPSRLFEIEWNEVTSRPHRHAEADCLEEELMFAAEESEDEMMLLNPWEENEDEMTLLNPWED